MKKLILTLALVLTLSISFSQANNSTPKTTSQNNDRNITTIVIAIIFTAIATSAGQYASVFWIRKKEKKLKHKRQLKLLISEMEDLMRHCHINLAILKFIDLEKGKPSDLHFEKMRIVTDSSILFSNDTFAFIKSKYTNHINRLRLNIRNINLEIDKIIQTLHQSNYDAELLRHYIDYLMKKFEISVDKNLPDRLATLKGVKIETIKAEAKQQNDKDLENVVHVIVYEKAYP